MRVRADAAKAVRHIVVVLSRGYRAHVIDFDILIDETTDGTDVSVVRFDQHADVACRAAVVLSWHVCRHRLHLIPILDRRQACLKIFNQFEIVHS
jgi:hypothetical protein